MEGDFHFLLCDRCQSEAKNPKLLACFHTLCAQCLEDNKPMGQCPVCGNPIQASDRFPIQDNLLFSSLQAKLDTYQKIVSDRELVCSRCREGATFWCSECQEFLCLKCYEAHQWYLKQKSHETQQLTDLRNETAQSFLEGLKKSCTLFCAEPNHNNQIISIYCRGCHKPLCCSCALLDGEHYNAKLYSDIRVEIDSRKKELSRLKEELGEKKRNYESTHNDVHERLKKLEKVRNETRELIQKKVEDMVQWIQQKGEQLVDKVDRRLCQEQEEAKKKLESTEQILKRMEAGEQLVEKMALFASDQEVMDMHPFIKDSLERLKKEKLPISSVQIQVDNFDEVRGELHALLKRVKGEDAFGCKVSTPGSHSSVVNSDSLRSENLQARSPGMKMQRPTYTVSVAKTSQGFTTSIISPSKRPIDQLKKSVQASPKKLKLEELECDAAEVSNQQGQENVPESQRPLFRESTPEPGMVTEIETPSSGDRSPARGPVSPCGLEPLYVTNRTEISREQLGHPEVPLPVAHQRSPVRPRAELKCDKEVLVERVRRLTSLLSVKRKQMATLRAMLKANKQTAEVDLSNLQSKHEGEKAQMSETMMRLRHEVKVLEEEDAASSSLRATLASRCDQYVSQLDEMQRQLKVAEDHKEVLNSLLRLAIQQKLELTDRLEALEKRQ